MTTTITPQQHLTVVKHLAGGKGLDVVATLTRLDRATVLDIGSKHGYPDTKKLGWAVEILEKKLDEDAAIPEHPDSDAIARQQQAAGITRIPPSVADQAPVKPDEIRILINTAKGHPSKRIQAAGDRVIDAVDRLKTLIREDQEKHAEKRREAEQRAAAKAEVDRLTEQLAAAKAKLRGSTSTTVSRAVAASTDSAQIRAWARESGVECPAVGRVPASVRDAYEAAQTQVAS